MKSDLVCMITYTPSEDIDSLVGSGLNFLCSDKKLHIRVRDYEKEELIHGFINKLTYIITYLIQGCSSTASIGDFVSKSSDFHKLLNVIEQRYYQIQFSGIKVMPNYRKLTSKKNNQIGSFSLGACPLKDTLSYGGLDFLLKAFNIDLYTLLFNDAVDIIIAKKNKKNVYTKFTNKINRRKNTKQKQLEYESLF